MEKELFVTDIKRSVGMVGETTFLVIEKEEKKTRADKPYLMLTLRDRTGDIKAKVWSDALTDIMGGDVGDVVKVSFEVTEYKDVPELTVSRMVVVVEINEEDYRISRDDVDVTQLETNLSKWVDAVRDFHLRNLLESFLKDEEFYHLYTTYPAGERVHHAYRHGLLQHTLEVIAIADGLYQLNPDMNRDLLVTGGLLHDIGKLYEYTEDELGVIGWTVEGRLLGHVVLGWMKVSARISPDMPKGTVEKLGHIILSHQGKLEFGSPIVPRIREAMAIAFADKASMDFDIAKSLRLESMDGDQFTEYNRYLGTDLYLG